MPKPSFRLLLPAQTFATLLAILIIILSPPVSGPMMLVPITDAAAGSVTTMALDSGALLLGVGPVSGSIVVVGSRSGLRRAMEGHAILVLAAPDGGCRGEGAA